MAKETVRRLSEDVGRVLVAGAHLAPMDPELKKDHEALVALAKQVGDRAPVIARLAETAGKAISGSCKTAAAELLGLATTAAQVKAAQAAPAAPGATRPIAEVPLVPTPCNGKDLEALYSALAEKGQGRKEVIERAVEGGYIADLRLVEALIYAMGDPWIGDLVTAKAIPALGRAVVNPIRQRLNLKGGTTLDARRLRALVAVQKEGALDVLAQAVRDGSTAVREAAMHAMADHVPGVAKFERYALEAIAKDGSAEVRRAAIRALGGYASDASLDALLEALDKAHLTEAAAEALGKSTNPKAVEKILARLGDAAVAAKAPAKKKAKAESKDKGDEARERSRRLCELLLGALAKHRDPAIARAALELVGDHGAAAAWAAAGSADRAQLARLADLLGGEDEGLFPVAAAAAARLGGDDTFQRLCAPFRAGAPRKPKGDKHGEARKSAVLEHLASNPSAIDRRLADLFLDVLQNGSRDQGLAVLGVLAAVEEKRAVPRLLAMLAAEKKPNAVVAIIRVLGKIGDKAVLDPILDRVDVKAARGAIQEAVLAINDPSSVDKVRTIHARQKDPDAWENWQVRSLLRTLETRFPGR